MGEIVAGSPSGGPDTPQLVKGQYQTMMTILNMMALTGTLMGAPGSLPPIEKAEVRDGRVLVNGQPFLPVLIYHAAHWHKGLPEAGRQGFNLVQVYGTTPEALRQDMDDTWAQGMYSTPALNGLCEDPATVERLVQACKDHPGLLCWALEDEPNIRLAEPADTPHAQRPYRLPPAKLQPIHDLIKRLDPAHPVWVNLAHCFKQDQVDYLPVADIHSNDVYPVPEAALPAVAAYLDVLPVGNPDKAVWGIIQMGPVRPQLEEKDRHPTMAEVRCMTYLALTHGAVGVGYYAFNERPGYDWRANESAPAWWAQWADLTAELRSLAPLLLAPVAKGEVKVDILQGSREPGPWGYPALHVSLREAEGRWCLLAVNGLGEAVRARITLPVQAPGEAAVRFEGRLTKVENNVIEDDFAPYAAHVYELPGLGG